MVDRPTSAAAALYPHLPSAASGRERAPNKQSLSALMYPNQTPEAKAQAAWRAREKERTLRHLREAIAAADARLRREGRSSK